MRVAYLDTSCLVAIAFGEPGSPALAHRLAGFDELVSANLLEAEMRAAFAREALEPDVEVLSAVSWIIPDRPLRAEIERVLQAGYLRGADCWHVAAALYLSAEPQAISFLTLCERQAEVARALGFAG